MDDGTSTNPHDLALRGITWRDSRIVPDEFPQSPQPDDCGLDRGEHEQPEHRPEPIA